MVICTAFSDKSWDEIVKRLGRTDKLLILKKPFDEIEVVQLANPCAKNDVYHYHAATGKTKELEQSDGHAPLIGYALDGFGIYAHLDNEGIEQTDLDECSGHYDDVRGYHYHAGAAGDNQIIGAFRGIAGSASVVTPD